MGAAGEDEELDLCLDTRGRRTPCLRISLLGCSSLVALGSDFLFFREADEVLATWAVHRLRPPGRSETFGCAVVPLEILCWMSLVGMDWNLPD